MIRSFVRRSSFLRECLVLCDVITFAFFALVCFRKGRGCARERRLDLVDGSVPPLCPHRSGLGDQYEGAWRLRQHLGAAKLLRAAENNQRIVGEDIDRRVSGGR